MKSFRSLILAVLVFFSLTGCANIYKTNKAELTIIPSSDITSNPAKWETIGKDLQEGKEFVFLIRKGQSIPLKVSASIPFANLNAGKNSLTFTKDVYLLISTTKMRLSLDGESWADIHDFHSLKQLLGYEKGDLSLGFSATKEEGTQINLNISAK